MNLKTLFRLLPVALLGTVSHAGISNVALTNNGFVSSLQPGYSLVEALNFQGIGTNLRGGITFTNENMTDGVGGKSALVAIGGGGLAAADIGSATDSLFFTETYNPSGTGLRLTLSGLDSTKTYFFEIYHGEARGAFSATFSADTFFDGTNTVNVAPYTLGNNIVDNAPQDRWTISATISGTASFQYTMPNAPGRGASIDGYQLQAIPEPSSVALLGASGLLALRRRRK